MKNKFLALTLALLLLAALLNPSSLRADAAPIFSLMISNSNPVIGNALQVEVRGAQLTDLYAYELNLTFDNSRLQFVSAATNSTGFSVPATVNGNKLQLAHSKVGPIAGENGNVTLATLTFNAISSGEGQVTLDTLTLVDSHTNATNAEGNASVAAVISSVNNNGNGNGNGGGQTTSPTPTATPTPTPTPTDVPTATVKPSATPLPIVVDATVSVNPATQTATSTIDNASLIKAIAEAKADPSGKTIVSIEIKDSTNANEYVMHLPSQVLLDNKGTVKIQIKTSIASVIVPSNMFKEGSLPAGGDIDLVIAKADLAKLNESTKEQIGNHPAIELSVQSGGQTIAWSNSNAPVSVSVAYIPTADELKDPEHIVVWYIDGQGKINPVVNGKYDPASGKVSFTTTHFSTYAIAFVKKSFVDITSVQWAQKQIEVLASKGIVNGISSTEFKPSNNVTRADFLVLLVRALELKGAKGASFADVRESDYYNEALQIARGLGIAEGNGDNLFHPLDSITRQDMMVLTARAMKAANKTFHTSTSGLGISDYTDNLKVSSYAKASVNALIESGLVHGFNNQINPNATTTRAESAVLLYNLYNQ